jgi:hypothetical protein
VVLALSDGSEIQLGENTQINIDDLMQTATGARVSRVKLLWDRIRAMLSPQHQLEGSAFDIETPNALIGVKFSQPDVEVSYDLEKEKTVAFAYTVALMATNLLTGETMLVPVGSTVIITGMTIKVVAGIVTGAGTIGAEGAGAGTGTAGIGTGKMIAIGAGALAAVGGIAAVAGGGGDGDGGSGTPIYDATGTWWLRKILTAEDPNGCSVIPLGTVDEDLITITQTGNTFTVTFLLGDTYQGTISGNTFTLIPDTDVFPWGETCTLTGEGTFTSDHTLEASYRYRCEGGLYTGERCVEIWEVTGIKQ